jgi:RecB family exonuclease
VQVSGLVDREWPERPRRNVFYGPSILRDLGWSSEAELVDHARAGFADLLRLASDEVTITTFGLEDDAIVTPSMLLDELDAAALDVTEEDRPTERIFADECLARVPRAIDALEPAVQAAALRRLQKASRTEARFHGTTTGHTAAAYSLSSLERYQKCPFQFFASSVLRIEELPEDEPFLSPRARGRFIHEVFQRFFEAWDARGAHTITAENLSEARALFADVAAPLLARLGESDAALERARLFGSAVAMGIVDVVLGLEASRPVRVVERWLERSFEGEYTLGSADGRRIRLRGIADRVDLLEGHALRVIDYKTGYAPEAGRALQVSIYALCAQEQASQPDGQPWDVAEAAYVAFSGKRALVSIVEPGDDAPKILSDARARLFDVVDAVTSGAFPPRPRDIADCRYCAFPSVCRKDYVDE